MADPPRGHSHYYQANTFPDPRKGPGSQRAKMGPDLPANCQGLRTHWGGTHRYHGRDSEGGEGHMVNTGGVVHTGGRDPG